MNRPPWIRQFRLYIAAAFCSAACLCAGEHGLTTVISDAKVILPIFVAPDNDPAEMSAANELARILGIMSGAPCEVRLTSDTVDPGFYIGRAFLEQAQGKPMRHATDPVVSISDGLGPDGFHLLNERGRIFIGGASPAATENAVYWLMEKYAGVRWYTPGLDGEIIPQRAHWSIADLSETVNPGYFSRELTGFFSEEGKLWAKRNGLKQRLEYSHAMDAVFPQSLLSERLDWQPQIDGKRYLPSRSDANSWQPNFCAPGIAAHAAAQAQAALSTATEKRYSFSLGINDSVHFDEGLATQAFLSPLRYFRRRPDYSPLVFDFTNRAAEYMDQQGVSTGYLGCLAYFWCEKTPPFRVHPRVLPYLTADRSQYFDHAFCKEDTALIAAWAKSGVKTFGLWEYAYGRNFIVPRQPLRALADALRHGHEQGARGYIAEIEPHWGFDGFKTWMLAKLLWEPNRSLDELKSDFFHGYYVEAANPMREFFERCESIWMQQTGETHWLKYFQHEDQILLFSPATCSELNILLSEAARKADANQAVSRRVWRTIRAFNVVKSYSEFDRIRRTLAEEADTKNLEHIARQWVPKFVNARIHFAETVAAASTGELPALCDGDVSNFTRNDPIPRLLVALGRISDTLPAEILAGINLPKHVPDSWILLARSLARDSTPRTNLLRNSNFLATSTNHIQPAFLHRHSSAIPGGWQTKAMPTEFGAMNVNQSQPDYFGCIRFTGAWDTQLYQWLPAEPGNLYLATCDARGSRSPGGDAALFMVFLSANGQALGTRRMHALPTGKNSDWRELCTADVSPPGTTWVGVGVGITRQEKDDWIEIRRPALYNFE